LQKVFASQARKSEEKITYLTKGHPLCYKVRHFTDTGFGYYFYKNESNKTLHENVSFQTFFNLELMAGHKGKEEFTVRVKPGREAIILIKIGFGQWDLQSKTKTLFK